MDAFTIKDLENLSGIKAHTIRIWEQRYGFLKPKRTDTNIRYYNGDELKRVLNIALLNKYGFRISHLGRMQEGEIRERILTLTDSKAVQDRMVNDLVQAMVDLDMDQFERILNTYIATRGIEKTVIQIIFPYLERIGILWQTGHINPAQEHLVTNIIRQKLIAGIETAHSLVKLDRTFLLFLPEGEHHELGLLFMYYILKSRGAAVLYLGCNVPIKDVEHVIRAKKPDIGFVHLTGTATNFNLDRFLQHCQQKLGIPLLISGQLIHNYKKKIPPDIIVRKSLSEVMEYLATL